MGSEKTSPDTEKRGIENQRREDFAEFYANNSQVLSSVWDLRLVFGQLDQSQGPNTIVQHSAVTLPWPQAKVMLYFLQMHLASHEAEHGKIIVPKGIIPEFPKPQKGKDHEKTLAVLRKLYEDFIAANPEAKP